MPDARPGGPTARDPEDDAGGARDRAGDARDGAAPETPGGGCRACRAPTVEGQRYCLACGELVGDRRLDPLAHLRTPGGTSPSSPPPPAAAPRAVPLAAAATAILVAGVSGALVTGGDGGARAAIIARPAPVVAAAPAVASAPDEPAAEEDDGAADDTADAPPADDAAADETAAVEEPAADDELPADDPVAAEPVGNDTSGGDADDGDADAPADEPITPHVWLLAVDGPQAQEAVRRIADQGVSLTGIRPLGGETAANVTGLVTGVRPVPAAPAAAGAAPPETTPSLPETLAAAKGTWRAYVDVQPNDGPALAGACSVPPVGDAAAAALAARLPFGRIAALAKGDACAKGVESLETLGNDVSSGETIPDFSYAALGGCAPPERTAVALPDQVADTVTAITESTEYQESGLVIVTAVGAADPCPATPPDPATPAPAAPLAADGTLAPTPTVVLKADAKPGSKLDIAADLLALTRLATTTLGVDPPGVAGADDVPELALPTTDG